jgi:hypothetical protein
MGLTSLLQVASTLITGGKHLSKLLVTRARTALRGNEMPSNPPKPQACAKKQVVRPELAKRGREKGRWLDAWCDQAMDMRALWAAKNGAAAIVSGKQIWAH